MANFHSDNFEFYGTSNLPGPFTAVSGSVTISNGKLRITGNSGSALISDRITSQGTWFANLRINFETIPTGFGPAGYPATAWPILTFFDAGNLQCGLFLRTDGKLQFFRGATSIGPASNVALDFDGGITYYDIEVKVTFGNTGSVECRVNGAVEITATSVDTTQTSNNTADSFRLGNNGIDQGVTTTANIDHIIFYDSSGSAFNNFLGPVAVILHTVTADGANTGWAVTGAASRFQAVDDATPNGDTDYVAAATVGTKVSFVISDLPAGVTGVKGGFMWLNQKRDDSTTRGDKALVRISGTDYLGGTEIFLNPNYIYQGQPFDVSPATSAAFTTIEINNLEIGAQVTT